MMKALAIIALLFGVFAIQSAQAIPQRTTYVFVMGCERVLFVEVMMSWTPPAYREYLTKPVVTCLEGADLATLDKVTVPLLRTVWPDDLFLFVYPDGQVETFRQVVERNGHGADESDGYALIEYGYALTPANQYLIWHEMLHVQSCLYHNRESDPVSKWYRPRIASRGRWCNVDGSLYDLS